MIHIKAKQFKKKSYLRPEMEAVWIDNEALMNATGSAHEQGWGDEGNEKQTAESKVYFVFSEDEDSFEEESWGTVDNSIW